MRIHLLCDHKWRDLPNLVATKLSLEALGHTVLISSTKDQHQMIRAFRPDCVVFNHLFAPDNQRLASNLRASGVAVVVLPTEGAVRPEFRPIAAGDFANEWSMDLFLAWSDPTAEDVIQRWGLDRSMVPTTGCTRFDFHSERYRSAVTTRAEFCAKYGLDESRPIVTWATAFGYAGIQRDEQRYQNFRRETDANGLATCYRSIDVDPSQVPKMFEDAREVSAASFVSLAKARPNVQFIVRPHPAESRHYYRELIDRNDLQNVCFCPQDYIWNVLAATDVHLHRQCTTAVEAWMWKRPTIEMGMDDIPQWSWPERERGSVVAESAEQLIDQVDNFLKGVPVDQTTLTYRDSYIRKWFGDQDGRRCEAAAKAIDRLVGDRGRRRTWMSPMGGLKTSMNDTIQAIVKYALNKPADERLFRTKKRAQGGRDKIVVRSDIEAYASILRRAEDATLAA